MTALTTLADATRRLTGQAAWCGVELGEHHLSAARLAGPRDRPTLAGSFTTSLEGAPAFGEPQGAAAWTEALRCARRAIPGRARDAVLSLPASQVDSFPLRLESQDGTAFIAELAAQAAERLPYPVGEAVVDCLDCGGAAGSGRRVILVAARAPVVRFALECARRAGFEPRAIEVAATALARLHRAGGADAAGGALVVHAGDEGTTIACVRDGAVQVTRSIPWGTAAIVTQLESALRIPRATAVRVLSEYRPSAAAGRTDRILTTLLTPVLEELAAEVEKVWTYARAEFRGRGPERILLAGGASGIPSIGHYLSQLNVDTVVPLDPWSRIGPGHAVASDPPSAQGPSLAVCLGLALRDAS